MMGGDFGGGAEGQELDPPGDLKHQDQSSRCRIRQEEVKPGVEDGTRHWTEGRTG